MKRGRTNIDDGLSQYLKLSTQGRISDLKTELVKILDQRNRMKVEMKRLKDENNGLKTDVTKLKTSLESLQDENEEYKDSMTDKIEQFKKLYEDKFQLIQSDREALIHKLRSKLSKQTEEDNPQCKSQEARTIKRLREKLKQKKDILNMTLTRTKELSDLNSEKDKLIEVKSRNLEDLVLINKRSEQENENLQKKIVDQKVYLEKIETLETKVKDQEVSLKNVSTVNEAQAARLSYIESEQETITESQEKMIEDANAEINDLKSIEKKLKVYLKAKNDELKDTVEKLEEVKHEIHIKTSEIDSCREECLKIAAENKELTLKNEELKSSNQNVIRENEDIRVDLEQKKFVIINLKETIKRQNSEIKNRRRPSSRIIEGQQQNGKTSVEKSNPRLRGPPGPPLNGEVGWMANKTINPVNIPHGNILEQIID